MKPLLVSAPGAANGRVAGPWARRRHSRSRSRVGLLLFFSGLGATGFVVQSARAETLVAYPFSSDMNPSFVAPGVTATLDVSRLDWAEVGDDHFGNVLQAYPRKGATSQDAALASSSCFTITLTSTARLPTVLTVTEKVGKGGPTDPRGFAIYVGDTLVQSVKLPSGDHSAPATYTFTIDTGRASSVTISTYVWSPNAAHSVDFGDLSISGTFPVPTIALGADAPANARSVVAALNAYAASGAAPPTRFDPIFSLTGDALRSKLSSLSGEAGLGGKATTMKASGQFMGAMLDPSAPGRGDPRIAIGGAAPALGYALEQASSGPAAAGDWSVWALGFGGEGRLFGDGATGASGVASNVAGVASGFDYRVSPDTTLGLAFAGGGTNWSMKNVSGSGRGDFFQAGVYGATRFGQAYVSGALAFGNQWTTTSRVASGDALRASFQARTWSGRLEGGYRFATSFGGLTPYAAVQGQNAATPAYAETGPSGGFGLSFTSQTGNAARAELGARYDVSAPLGAATLTLRAKAAFAHDWVKTPTFHARFVSLPGSGFTTTGATPARNAALLSGGAEVAFANGVAVFGKMDGEFSTKGRGWLGSVGVKYVW